MIEEAGDEPFTVCPYCQQRISPEEPGVIYAMEQIRVDAMGSTQLIDGMGGWFHPSCPPGPVGYARRPRPE